MSEATPTSETSTPRDPRSADYVVVARRYRPQLFADLVGQEHATQALSNAITTNRVGHAYLFTGARGVGKTSAARIFAKALNCERGPSPAPCNECEICRSISSGDDVDVLEIDGASNRGIDEIRQLRQNVNVRPSRTRFKIYIIDEVHMLTREAFNALLKTLEEPPEHVKFFFCTTEPTKIPITILSRCQRFDFAGIQTDSIRGRLSQIAAAEGVEADSEALDLLARRAAGSMRDAQSLLEQLLSFAPVKISAADVHSMLGTAGDDRLHRLASCLVDRDPAGALAELDTAARESVDFALLLEQLFCYLRDAMAAAAGCPSDILLYAAPSRREEVSDLGRRLGLQNLLAAMQILDQTLSRMRYSTQGRILAELAVVRICSLEDLDELAGVIAGLRSGVPVPMSPSPRPQRGASQTPRSHPVKQAPPPEAVAADPSTAADNGVAGDLASDSSEPSEVATLELELTEANVTEVWSRAVGQLEGMAAEPARQFAHVRLPEANRIQVTFKAGSAFNKTICEQPGNLTEFEESLRRVVGRRVRVSFAVEDGPAAAREKQPPAQVVSPHQRLMEITKHPMIRRAGELFGATPTEVIDPPDRS
ncbi:MAG: DNA polymerase III subunit gamma/tau [Planctomycetaceae bacterium]|nr:DNA polymerase III subunit gamma/tau [Planctomycetaceae bacterium]